MTRTLADTDAAAQFPALVAELAETDHQVKITHGGSFAAMLVSPRKWRSIIETLDILADLEAVADLQEAGAEAAAGGGIDVEDVATLVARRRDAAADLRRPRVGP
jgi:antitoxin YefM